MAIEDQRNPLIIAFQYSIGFQIPMTRFHWTTCKNEWRWTLLKMKHILKFNARRTQWLTWAWASFGLGSWMEQWWGREARKESIFLYELLLFFIFPLTLAIMMGYSPISPPNPPKPTPSIILNFCFLRAPRRRSLCPLVSWFQILLQHSSSFIFIYQIHIPLQILVLLCVPRRDLKYTTGFLNSMALGHWHRIMGYCLLYMVFRYANTTPKYDWWNINLEV